MITIQAAMMVALGLFTASLVAFLLAPFYRRRAARMAIDELKRSMPLTEAEIRADKDRLRAEHAISLHKLEQRAEEMALAAARQMVEINRRDAAISATEGEVQRLKSALEEHENARRVLEQTIEDRLPRVEHRLNEAKKLLGQRDREIAELTSSSSKQTQSLEEATQINAQLRDEIHRLNATITTRAARNREALAADPRFDGEVALRAEIEALRSKTRDQAQMLSRLQAALSQGAARAEAAPEAGGSRVTPLDFARLSHDLSEAEVALKAARSATEAGQASSAQHDGELRVLRAQVQDQLAEIARLKAALKTYEAEDADGRAVKESKLAMKSRLSSLEAQAGQQSAIIQSLRAEVAAANEKLARQAAHFMDEMRRLGSGTVPATGPSRREAQEKGRVSLARRISEPRSPPAPASVNNGQRQETPAHAGSGPANGHAEVAPRAPHDPTRMTGFLRALSGAADESRPQVASAGTDTRSAAAESATASFPSERAPGSAEQKSGTERAASDATAPDPSVGSGSAEAPQPAKRRPTLLERLAGADKPAASG